MTSTAILTIPANPATTQSIITITKPPLVAVLAITITTKQMLRNLFSLLACFVVLLQSEFASERSAMTTTKMSRPRSRHHLSQDMVCSQVMVLNQGMELLNNPKDSFNSLKALFNSQDMELHRDLSSNSHHKASNSSESYHILFKRDLSFR